MAGRPCVGYGAFASECAEKSLDLTCPALSAALGRIGIYDEKDILAKHCIVILRYYGTHNNKKHPVINARVLKLTYTLYMRTLIRNIDAVVSGRIVHTDIMVEDGIFRSFDGKPDRTIDGTGLTAVPGFIDTHIHGVGGYGTEDGTEEAVLSMSRTLAEAGVTSFFPTIYTDTMERILMDEDAIASASGKEEGASIAGIHIEGPFISPNRIGAQNPAGRLDPDMKAFSAMIAAGKGKVRAMTAAPELPGMERIAAAAKESGVVLLMGHTNATYEEAMKGMDMGIRHTTHLFNAMSGFQHRKPGVVGCALMHDAMTVEIIADGKHVHQDIVLYVIKAKGPERTV